MSTSKLTDYKVFKIIYIIGLCVFIGSSISIIITDVLDNNVGICGSRECFVNFINIFSFPIDVAKATIALLALAALLHKSEETQYQIRISLSQNTYSNYFHHRKIINDELGSKILDDTAVRVVSFNDFYNLLFPSNKPDRFEFTSDLGNVESLYRSFFEELFKQDTFTRVYGRTDLGGRVVRLGHQTIKDRFNVIREFDDAIFELFENLGLRVIYENLTPSLMYIVYHKKSLTTEEFKAIEAESISSYDISNALILMRNVGEVINKLSYSDRNLNFLTIGNEIFQKKFETSDTLFMIMTDIDNQNKKIIKDLIKH